MIRKILSVIGKILSYLIPVAAFLILLSANVNTTEQVKALQAQVSELEANQATSYDGTIKVEQALLKIDEGLFAKSDKDKAEAKVQNDALLKVIYGVDKASTERDQAIVDGVNGVVTSFNDTLSKPSYNYLRSITVRILAISNDDPTKGWIGTGVIVGLTDNSTIILTNRHVMPNDGLHKFYVIEGKDKYPLLNIKVSADEDVDLSLNVIQGHIDGKRAVRGIADVKPQDAIYTVGSNLGRAFFYAEGTVAGYSPKEVTNGFVINAPTGPGNSGSGVIDHNGRLVGLVFAGSLVPLESIAGPIEIIQYMDLTHGLCIGSKTIRLFLAPYLQ